MLTSCPKCGENSEAKLDYVDKNIDKSKVLCLNCGLDLELNAFTKRSMLQRNDVIERRPLMIPPDGLMYTCDNIKCRKQFSAEVRKKDKKVYCPFCKEKANIAQISLDRLMESKIFEGYSEQYFKNEEQNTSESEAIEQAIEGSDASGGDLNTRTVPLDDNVDNTTTKRGRGRPAGSKNKPKAPAN